ncbi:MAG: oligosaccharide flippase family protein [Burkholderiales bacterium]|nr:oligosaccharide flippase family protein [Burkholderiales bacterium]
MAFPPAPEHAGAAASPATEATHIDGRTVRNAAWLGVAQVLRQAVAVGAAIMLARYLGPADYGLFAIVFFINELAQSLVDFGIGTAIVQRKAVDQRLLSTCFWANLGLGLGGALVLVALGPWLAAMFGQPVIPALMGLCGLNLLCSALQVLPRALLSRALAFRPVALAGLAASVAGAARAVALASAGAGVWALVVQPLVGALVGLGWMQHHARWWPSPVFDRAEARRVARFSAPLLGGTLAMQCSRNLQNLILGPAVGVAGLGRITMAQTVASAPVSPLSEAVARASFPVLAQAQDAAAQMRARLLGSIELLALAVTPVLVGLAVLAADLVPVVLGPQWQAIVAVVPALCGVAWVQAVTALGAPTLLAAGHGPTLLRLALLGLAATAACLGALRGHGWAVAAVGLGLLGATLQLLLAGAACTACAARWRDAAARPARAVLCSMLMGAALLLGGRLVAAWPPVPRLLLLVAAGALAYVAASLVFNTRGLVQARGLLRAASRSQ